jgi:hypothetical protein
MNPSPPLRFSAGRRPYFLDKTEHLFGMELAVYPADGHGFRRPFFRAEYKQNFKLFEKI